MGGTGKKNPNWRGGIAEYHNHGLMKQNRLIKLKQTKGKCEVCGKKAGEIHHKDGSTDNHSMGNLAVLCKSCHSIVHAGRKNKTSKFMRLYGKTLCEIAEFLGVSSGWVYTMHRKGKLSGYLEGRKVK